MVNATASDPTGNTSAPATTTVDSVAPAAPVVNPSNGAEISGTAEPGATVTLTDGSGNPIGQVTADGSGNWSFTPSTPLVKNHNIKVDTIGSHLKIEVSPHAIDGADPRILQGVLDDLAAAVLSHCETNQAAVHIALDVQGWTPPADLVDRMHCRSRRVRQISGIERIEFDGNASVYGRGETYTVGDRRGRGVGPVAAAVGGDLGDRIAVAVGEDHRAARFRSAAEAAAIAQVDGRRGRRDGVHGSAALAAGIAGRVGSGGVDHGSIRQRRGRREAPVAAAVGGDLRSSR